MHGNMLRMVTLIICVLYLPVLRTAAALQGSEACCARWTTAKAGLTCRGSQLQGTLCGLRFSSTKCGTG